jgi:hypothetical protein
MSGPIVRKYGFPNFEKIFGERELKHGAESEASTPPASPSPDNPTKPNPGAVPTTKEETDLPKT